MVLAYLQPSSELEGLVDASRNWPDYLPIREPSSLSVDDPGLLAVAPRRPLEQEGAPSAEPVRPMNQRVKYRQPDRLPSHVGVLLGQLAC